MMHDMSWIEVADARTLAVVLVSVLASALGVCALVALVSFASISIRRYARRARLARAESGLNDDDGRPSTLLSGLSYGEDKSVLIVLGSGGHTSEMVNLLESVSWDSLTTTSKRKKNISSRVTRRYVIAETDNHSVKHIDALERSLLGDMQSEGAKIEPGDGSDGTAKTTLKRRKSKKLATGKQAEEDTQPKRSRSKSVTRGSPTKENGIEAASVIVDKIPRSREVHSSTVRAVCGTLVAILHSMKIVFLHTNGIPNVTICNGPGTCIPICLWVLVAQAIWPFVKLYSFVTSGPKGRYVNRPSPRIVFVESLTRVNQVSLTGKLLYLVADRFLVQWPQLSDKYKLAEYKGILV